MSTAASRAWEVFRVFLRLGLTSFGGPVAHLGYFHAEFVTRRGWLGERAYADLVALCQFLPGPASSQVGLAIGLLRAGYSGALAAWLGFTLPSAALLIAFAMGLAGYGEALPDGLLQGLKVVAVAVVAQALWSMARTLCPDRPRISLMTAACCAALLLPGAWTQIGLIGAAALIGVCCLPIGADSEHQPLPLSIRSASGMLWLAVFLLLLLGLPLAVVWQGGGWLERIDAFFRAGSLVFGGGHVVLPLLQAEVVPTGWVDADAFLAGYGAAQAVPGPLFTFAAYLGAVMGDGFGGWQSGLICLLAVFAPSFLLVAGALPFWEGLRRRPRARSALAGVNAGVVGLLLAALYDPVASSALHGRADFALAVLALIGLTHWKLPPWLVVLACALAGWLLAELS
jgi:chromate transporter